ncbi:alpha/beta hydrolase [Chloroflexia bacterium SDU3-3]|nr:alpha/beta hydrolase [Chloroflexia bacterium SDU3-3]
MTALKTIQIGSQTVAYYESAGDGPTVVLIHGNSSSGRAFQRQLESPLGQAYHLVAIDLPGLGDSQPVPEPESVLGLRGWADVVVKTVAALGLESPVLVGWSLGGHIALEATTMLPNLRGVLIFGTPPIAFPPAMEQAFLPHPAMASSFNAELSDEEMRAYVAAFFRPGVAELPENFIEDIRRSSGQARAAVAGSIRPDGYTDEVSIVGGLTVPLAVIHGEQEQLISGAYIAGLTMPTLWRGQIQIIGEAGHAPQWEQPEQFNALLDAFVRECNQ